MYTGNAERFRLGEPETYVRERPMEEPIESEQVLKLAGVMPYE